MARKRILWITRTAIFIALLVVLQGATRPLGQYVTGSVVNLVLVASVLLGGLWAGVAVAALSPLFAFLVGVGPALPPVLPFVALGNLAIVLVWHFVAGRATGPLRYIIAVPAGACAKFLVLYLGIVKLLVPVLLRLSGPPAVALSASFSYPQLVTALVGGALAALAVPPLKRALRLSAT